MRTIFVVALCLMAVGCRNADPPGGPSIADELARSPLRLSLEYPNAPDGEVRNREPITIHVHNQSKGEVRVLTNYAQAMTVGQLKLGVRDAKGQPIRRAHPYRHGPPQAPTEADYTRIKPGEACRIRLPSGDLANAYGLETGVLYFAEVSLQPEGLQTPCVLRCPFGFASFKPEN